VEAGPDIASIMDARKRTLERISDSEKKWTNARRRNWGALQRWRIRKIVFLNES
jgi:hypothetical protein